MIRENQSTVILASSIFDEVADNKWVDKNGSRTVPIENKSVQAKGVSRKRATSKAEVIYNETYY